ncbi:hypothetical protein [Geopseudomonas sagittaria]|uniref:hypothetical protein n=1 Tax=Geopseudomonas sagittaria TaxID=1135990 RepID=UPI00111411EE|nr:hypothetical protein [Pseudomonas sagittaria]
MAGIAMVLAGCANQRAPSISDDELKAAGAAHVDCVFDSAERFYSDEADPEHIATAAIGACTDQEQRYFYMARDSMIERAGGSLRSMQLADASIERQRLHREEAMRGRLIGMILELRASDGR